MTVTATRSLQHATHKPIFLHTQPYHYSLFSAVVLKNNNVHTTALTSRLSAPRSARQNTHSVLVESSTHACLCAYSTTKQQSQAGMDRPTNTMTNHRSVPTSAAPQQQQQQQQQ
jgi:hypothetical protein